MFDSVYNWLNVKVLGIDVFHYDVVLLSFSSKSAESWRLSSVLAVLLLVTSHLLTPKSSTTLLHNPIQLLQQLM
jgi:hypothetical protein